jgi:hypothetical protein
MPIPLALAAAIPSLVQGVMGGVQYATGRKDAKNNERPTYNIPGEINEIERIAKKMAASYYLPGESLTRNAETEAMQSGINNALGAAGSGVDALAAVSGMQAGQNRAENSRAVARASRSDQMMESLKSTLQTVANYEDKKWEMNTLNPYLDKAGAASGLQGSGLQNIMGGLDGITSAFLMSKMADQYKPDAKEAIKRSSEVLPEMPVLGIKTIPGGVTNPNNKLAVDNSWLEKIIGGVSPKWAVAPTSGGPTKEWAQNWYNNLLQQVGQ